jgi:uncharacterized protein
MLNWIPIFAHADPPIFRRDERDRTLFYAPGWLAVAPRDLTEDFHSALLASSPTAVPGAAELSLRAADAQRAWSRLHSDPFAPLCLTLYFSNDCNLNCTYCFSQPYRTEQTRLSLETIHSAAELVAENCRVRGAPFTVVFHGGGEPTMEYDLMRQALDAVETIAAQKNLPLFRYIATNGVVSALRASALARRFDLVGLSCDGPDDIQNRQRPIRANGMGSAAFVKRTAQAIHAEGKPLHIRVTVTPETRNRQAEIAEYLCRELQPQEIHVEPVYDAGDLVFRAEQAEMYVDAFLQARRVAQQHGIPWLASGSRPDDIHDAYCHIWRNVLNLTPEGIATACFKVSDGESARRVGFDIGAPNGKFTINENQIQKLRGQRVEPEACQNCFNRYHCARSCPDTCLLQSAAPTEDFRCRVQSLLADAIIQETADRLAPSPTTDRIVCGPVQST